MVDIPEIKTKQATTPGQSGPEGNRNKGLLYIP